MWSWGATKIILWVPAPTDLCWPPCSGYQKIGAGLVISYFSTRCTSVARGVTDREEAVEYGWSVDPGYRRPAATLKAASAVVVDLPAPERAEDFRLRVG